MFLRDFIAESVHLLQALYSENEAMAIVRKLTMEVLDIKEYTYITEPNFNIEQKHLITLNKAMDKLLKAIPLQYVLGRVDFYNYSFKVSPAVLIPRPETEYLCKLAIDKIASMRQDNRHRLRLLDLCTGSACIAWTMALEIPNIEVFAVDVSDEALEVAKNQDLYKYLNEGHIAPTFVHADILKEDFTEYGQFDIIISNPPYLMSSQKSQMDRNVLDYEPDIALFAPDYDPLIFYKSIANWSKLLRDSSSFALLEINDLLVEETKQIFSGKFNNVLLIKDLQEKDRYIFYQL